jgi:hypothetical protein
MKFEDKVIKFHMDIGINNATQRDTYKLSDFVDQKDWDDMSKGEKDNKLQQWALDWSDNYLDLGASVDE